MHRLGLEEERNEATRMKEEENEKLRMNIERRSALLERLTKISLSSASLLNSVDSSSKTTEISSARYLSLLNESSALEDKEETLDEDKEIMGRYINTLIAKIGSFCSENEETIDSNGILKLSLALMKMFKFGEDRGIIPLSSDTESWKMKISEIYELLKVHSQQE